MTAKRKNVVRVDLPVNPAFDERLKREPDVDLTICMRAGPEEESWAALARAHVFHVSASKDELPRRWFVTPELLARCPALLCVSSFGAGYDTIDVPACTRAGVAVVNQAGGNANAVAEHAFGLMLALSRRIFESDRRLRRERGFTREEVMGHDIGGKTLGIVGIGHVGTRSAALGRAFGMNVLASDPYLTEEEIGRRGAASRTLDDLLAQSDIVSLHCPRAKDTLGMMNARAFGRMKRGALFITTARGGIHDESDLLEALRSGQIGGAGLDVWDQEPPPLDHPLLKLENVIANFHTAGVTHEARRNMAAIAAEQIAGVLKGGRPPRLLNPEVWPAYAARFEAELGAQLQVLDAE
jgi:D-3-phosphoglycerate dehydrogenase